MEKKEPRNKRLLHPFSKTTVLFVLICFCLSTFLASQALARFASENDGKGNVHVAVFAADVGSSDSNTLKLDSGEDITSASYTFWVTNKKNESISEVKEQYTVNVKVPSDFPEGISVLVDGKDGTVLQDGQTHIFTDSAWILDPSIEKTNAHTLTFTADFEVVEDDFTTTDIGLWVDVQQVN